MYWSVLHFILKQWKWWSSSPFVNTPQVRKFTEKNKLNPHIFCLLWYGLWDTQCSIRGYSKAKNSKSHKLHHLLYCLHKIQRNTVPHCSSGQGAYVPFHMNLSVSQFTGFHSQWMQGLNSEIISICKYTK